MMYKIKEQVDTICVLRIDIRVVEIDGVSCCDGNASSDYTRFYTRENWQGNLNFDVIFMDDWTSEDQYEMMNRKRQKCAEVLIPNCVAPQYITGAYVGNGVANQNLIRACFTLDIKENKHIFFL